MYYRTYQSPERNGSIQIPTLDQDLSTCIKQSYPIRYCHEAMGLRLRYKMCKALQRIRSRNGSFVGRIPAIERDLKKLNHAAYHAVNTNFKPLDSYSIGNDNLELDAPSDEEVADIRVQLRSLLRLDRIAAIHDRGSGRTFYERFEEYETALVSTYGQTIDNQD